MRHHSPFVSFRFLVARGLPIAALCALLACGGEAAAPEIDETAVVPAVEMVQARTGTLPLTEHVNGVVEARNQVAIQAEVGGRVVEVLVRSGEAVERGQALVHIEASGLREQVQQTEAALRLAEAERAELAATVVRSRALAEQGLVSELQLETEEAQLEAAEARVDQARATLEERRVEVGRAVVRAPVAGRVGRRDVEVGMLVDPSTVLFVLGDLDDLLIEVPLTEAMLAHVRTGQRVEISSPALQAPIEATLSRISPFLGADSFATTGEIDLGNPGQRLQPGMFVGVDIHYGESETATLVPTSAVWQQPDSRVEGVFVVDLPADATPPSGNGPPSEQAYPVEFRPVDVVAEGSATVGVRDLEPGEWVVAIGQHLLARGETNARVRRTSWERILELQSLQREAVLEGFLERQRRLAAQRGTEPPTSAEFLQSDSTASTGTAP